DRRPDLAARRLCGRRATDADGPRHLTVGRRVGDEQLAGHRQLLQKRQRGAVDALRRPGSDGLLRHGQAGAHTADRAGPATVVRRHGLLRPQLPYRVISPPRFRREFNAHAEIAHAYHPGVIGMLMSILMWISSYTAYL